MTDFLRGSFQDFFWSANKVAIPKGLTADVVVLRPILNSAAAGLKDFRDCFANVADISVVHSGQTDAPAAYNVQTIFFAQGFDCFRR